MLQETSFFFGNRRVFPSTATWGDCTCAIIKPHAVLSGKAGLIIQDIIDGGFAIHAIELFKLESEHAKEFYEVYKGVVPEYTDMVDELTSGPVIAMELHYSGGQSVKNFRAFCGPSDPEIAKKIRPNTIRGKYGVDKVQK